MLHLILCLHDDNPAEVVSFLKRKKMNNGINVSHIRINAGLQKARGPVAGFCGHGNAFTGFIRGEKFLVILMKEDSYILSLQASSGYHIT